MNNSPDLKAIIWDMDGTMFDTEQLDLSCWEEICMAHGYKEPRPTLVSCIGKNVRDTDEILMRHFGSDFDIASLRAEQHALLQKKIDEFGIPIKDGILETLAWTATHSIPNGLASSSNRARIIANLETSDLCKHFDVIIGGDQITQGKPDPEIFLKAAEELGVRPEECIVFEDSQYGIIAANEAGMHVVMIPDLISPTDEILKRTNYLLTSGTEIIALLERLFPLS